MITENQQVEPVRPAARVAYDWGTVFDTAVFYGGFALTGIYLVLPIFRRWPQGYCGRKLLPQGYFLSLLGALIFAAGGLGDMVWHTLFGLENGPEALMSPSHLTLAVGFFLILTGHFRPAWHRTQDASSLAASPWVFPRALSLTGLTCMVSYANPLANTLADNRLVFSTLREFINPTLGFTSIMVLAALTMGWLLLAMCRWTLPAG